MGRLRRNFRHLEQHTIAANKPEIEERVAAWIAELRSKVTDKADVDRITKTVLSLAGWLDGKEVNEISMIEYCYFLVKTLGVKPHRFARNLNLLRKIDEVEPHIKCFYCAMVSHDHLIPDLDELTSIAAGLSNLRCRVIAMLRANGVSYETMADSKINDYDPSTGIFRDQYRFTGKAKRVLDRWYELNMSKHNDLHMAFMYIATRHGDIPERTDPVMIRSLLRICLSRRKNEDVKFYNRRRIEDLGKIYYYSRKRYR